MKINEGYYSFPPSSILFIRSSLSISITTLSSFLSSFLLYIYVAARISMNIQI